MDQISARGGSRLNNKFGGGDDGGGGDRGSWSGGGRVREGGGGMMRSEVVASRPQSSVVVSGGGTFRSAMASTTRAPSFGSAAGPARRQGVARVARDSAAPYQRPTRASDSVFNRLGETEREREREGAVEREGHKEPGLPLLL